mgnify:FL=1
MARIFDNFAMFGYMKKNWKESKKKKMEVERKRKEKDSRFLLMCLDNGRKGKGKRKYFFFKLFFVQTSGRAQSISLRMVKRSGPSIRSGPNP